MEDTSAGGYDNVSQRSMFLLHIYRIFLFAIVPTPTGDMCRPLWSEIMEDTNANGGEYEVFTYDG